MVTDVTDWLLDADPAIRWQVRRDLTDDTREQVAAERTRVAEEGWGARLLGLQGEDGQWGGGSYTPKWTSTTYTLLLLRQLGIDPDDERMRAATGRVAEGAVIRGDRLFFDYATEVCRTGMALALGSYFLADVDGLSQPEYLLERQRDDGGWNCQVSSPRSSFHTTISVLEALAEYEVAVGGDTTLEEARTRAHEYLLERRLMYSMSTGELINSRWQLMSFPPRWPYDILRGLDYLREAGVGPDPRCEEAIEVVRSKQLKDGTWPLQNRHAGKVHFEMEEGSGKPSRWNTLRALRTLRWYDD
ncbi:MAG: hypothetical protein GEU79_00605 [Acidimicrobiia bacterium]|nr:hypothetical protein [Acidimicrobiia bacterium]